MLEPAERLRRRPVMPGVEPEAGEVALHSPLSGPSPLDGADDLGDLGGGALRDFAFERLSEIQQPLLDHRLTRSGHRR